MSVKKASLVYATRAIRSSPSKIDNVSAETGPKIATCRLKMMMEMECFGVAVHTLVTTKPKHKIVNAIPEEVTKEVEGILKYLYGLAHALGQGDVIDFEFRLNNRSSDDFWKRKPVSPDHLNKPWADTDPDLFPLSIALMGSTGLMLLLHKCGKLTFSGVNVNGGRTFLGLGSLLTGGKSYEEITELAKVGDEKKLNLLIQDGEEGQKDEKYKAFQAKNINYTRALFGKAMNTKLDDWEVCDVSRTFLTFMAEDMARFAFSIALLNNSKRVLFAGSTPNDKLIQDEITKQFEINKYTHPVENVHHEFLKNGGFYGALGALICSTRLKD